MLTALDGLRQQCQTVDLDRDDITAERFEGELQDLQFREEALRREGVSAGLQYPRATVDTAESQALESPLAGKRMAIERTMLNIEQSLQGMQDAIDAHAARPADSKASYSFQEYPPQSRFRSRSSSGTESHSRGAKIGAHVVGFNGAESEDDDEAEEPLSPRGVYMQRCLPMTKQDILDEQASWLPFARISRADHVGLLLFLLYVAASIFYLFTRCAYSLEGLGAELWYGAIVLSAEMLMIFSLVFYGVWLCAFPDNTDLKVSDNKAVDLRRGYVIRVMVPCCDESLAQVRRTIASVRNAVVPEGCHVKIYLCDEARDSAKRDYVGKIQGGTDVIYVSARVRGDDDDKPYNPKAETLNWALSLIYPFKERDGRAIPLSELVCLMNADQTCSSSFFVNLLRYIDSGDDIAAALSPKIMFNVNADCDIFDHQNVHFWEKMQCGMDAFGFISLSSTNTILRARALQDCGWFPTTTLASDWELGMRMKARRWKSRYVQEYCAIGQAPEELADSYDAHYRSARGHFQTFWSDNCPLVNRDLGMIYRLFYASRALSLFAAGVYVPIFTLVPVVQLIFGYFPMTLDRWVVIGITVYYCVQTLMLYYCTSFKHMRALWLARVNTAAMWWPSLKAATLVPLKAALGRHVSFKPRGGTSSLSARNFACLRWPVVLVLLQLIAGIGGLINLREVITAPAVLSLCMLLYSIVPPLLVICAWNFRQGQLLSRLCSLGMLTQLVAFVLGIVFLWLLHPRDVDYYRAADLSLSFLDAQRSGRLSGLYPVPWRATTGLDNAVTVTFTNLTGLPNGGPLTESLTVRPVGGFYNDGDIGAVKVTWNNALTVTMLAWSLLDYRDFWQRDEELLNHALDLLDHGMQYINECYAVNTLPNPEDPSRPANTDFDTMIYVVGSAEKERQLWRRPEDIREPQVISEVPLSESPSDLSGQVAAALSSAALALELYGVIEKADARTLVNKAHRVFRAALFTPGLYTEALNGTSFGLEDHYPSFAFGDDLFWAATWMYRASISGYRTYNVEYYSDAMEATMDLAYADRDIPGVSWNYVNNMAVVHAATLTRSVRYHEPAQSLVWDWLCDGDQVSYTRNGRAFYFETPHLGSTVGAAALASVYIHKSKDWSVVRDNQALMRGIQCFAVEQGRYVLGGQVRGMRRQKPFIIGYNDRSYTRTWHRGASCPAWPATCDISVAFEDNPDENTIFGALLWNPIFEDFPVDARGRNTTVVSLENNFAMPLLWPGLELQDMSFTECLNDQKTAFWDRAFCRADRPADYQLGPREAARSVGADFQGLYLPKPVDVRAPPPPPPSPRPIVLNVGGNADDELVNPP